MQILAETQGNVVYLHLRGEIDEHNAHSARTKADRLVERYAGSERAIFDLREVSFMDSTGIGFLIGRYKRFQRFGVPVYLTNPTNSTDKILEMSGIYTLMPKV
ncbi:MAG: STAS domain-containing protein [Clostridia bacterium]|nr:STAS domain-containing protein [Clostridia bacterium]